MSKSLSILQKIAKIAKIVCKVLFILCIVGGIGCLFGLLILLVLGRAAVDEIGLFASVMGENPYLAGAFGCIAGMITCIGEAILFRYGERYFTNELAAGTPFTQEGSKEIFRLGIASIIVSAAASTLSAMVYGIFLFFTPALTEIDISMSWSIGTGLTLLLLSVIFRYGAELREPPAAPQAPEEVSTQEATREEPKFATQTENVGDATTQSFDVL